jgi:hypothetical protein
MKTLLNYYSFLNESYKVELIDPDKWENVEVSSLPKLSLIDDDYREDFAKKVTLIANGIGVEPEHLMAVMFKESGLKSNIINTKSGAVGLIQFMKSTLAGMINPETNRPYTQEEVKNMNPVDQLDLVYSYLKNSGLKNARKNSEGKLEDPADLYLSIFLPITLGKPNSYTIEDKWVRGNEGLFKDNPEHNLGKLRDYMREHVLNIPPSEWTQLDPEAAGTIDKENADPATLLKRFSDFLETIPKEEVKNP